MAKRFIRRAVSTLGKSAVAKNAALSKDTAYTLLKNKLGMESVKSRARHLGGNAARKYAKKSVLKGILGKGIGTAAGLGIVGGVALAGYQGIKRAKKGVDKAVDEVDKQAKASGKSNQALMKELKRRKKESGMSLKERRKKKKEDAKKAAAEKEVEWKRKWDRRQKSTDFRKWE